MAETLLIPLVLGTGREGRRSEAVAPYMVEQLTAAGFETPFIDELRWYAKLLKPARATVEA